MASNQIPKRDTEYHYSEEMLLDLALCGLDPTFFIKKFVKIKHPVRGLIPFEMYDYQEGLIESFTNNRFNIVLSSRQSGKTATVGAYLLWFALFKAKKTILVVSNKGSNAKEIIAAIQNMYLELPGWLKPGVTDTGWNKQSMEFENGSRIIAETTSENSGRGMQISLLFCDEFAFVPDHVQDEFWASIIPVLSTGGDCIIASTPHGDSNLYHTMWVKASQDPTAGGRGVNASFFPTFIKWDMVPGRDDKYKKAQIKILGDYKWRQEFECEFLSAETGLFDSLTLTSYHDTAEAMNVLFTVNDTKFWTKLNPMLSYIVTLDPATGTGEDYSVIDVFSFPDLEQVAQWRSNVVSPAELYKSLKLLLRFLEEHTKEVYFTYENNAVGQAITALYEADENPPEKAELVSDMKAKKLGFETTGKSKNKYCFDLKQIVENFKIKINSLQTVFEMKVFERKGGTFQAKNGFNDDTISTLILLIRVIDEISQFDEDAYDHLYRVDESVSDESNPFNIASDNPEFTDYGDEDGLPFIF